MVNERKKQKICIIVRPQEVLMIYVERMALGMKQKNNIKMNIKTHCISMYEVSSYPHFSQFCFFVIKKDVYQLQAFY
jgi:hypothetical protein